MSQPMNLYFIPYFILFITIIGTIKESNSVLINTDLDLDGIEDTFEQFLAEKYAPIVYYSPTKPNFPTNVDVFLNHTDLYIYDDKCDFPQKDVHRLIKSHPTQHELITEYFDDNFCGSSGLVKSNGTRSYNKQRTFYLKDVEQSFRVGSQNPSEWTTYFHAYQNIIGGITIQYWRFYAYNTGLHAGILEYSHGGDWECIQVILDANMTPCCVDMLGHKNIERIPWESTSHDGMHPKISVESGGHTTIMYNDQPGIRQESWTNGNVLYLDGRILNTGQLMNVGEKISPLNNQYFIQYSGIWGSPGDYYFTSGYWSPSYNETAMNPATGFITAWCQGMQNSDGRILGETRECYPLNTSR